MTRNTVRFLVLIVAVAYCGSSSTLKAATINAASCAVSDVQAAIDSAVSGDTILVPPGECTWSSTVRVPDNRKITLSGAGMDATVITHNGDGAAVDLGRSGSRLTGFAFTFLNGSGVHTYGDGWRVDHCRFDNPTTTSRNGVFARGTSSFPGPQGLVDNCVFVNMRVVVFGDASLMANGLWARPLNLGLGDTVYIEDCEFSRTIQGNTIDTNYGGSYVFRYNRVIDSTTEAHSVQGTHRGSRRWEIYNNEFRQANRSMWAPFFQRGGTGVIFNNTITGTWSSPNIVLDNVRSFSAKGEGGLCDGSSPWDGNEESNGYPCRDQIGRSTDSWLWTSDNPYPPQQLDPAYFWNNTHAGGSIGVVIHNNSGHHIKEGRDYFNNVQKPGYTPYPYPHPLRQSSEEVPSSPSNLRTVGD